MRGTRLVKNVELKNAGIIPAYAGNTSVRLESRSRRRDHPRICGEHWWGAAVDVVDEGSSPHMRGTHNILLQRLRDEGIIPAYAGNTKATTRHAPTCGDHPRICGEHMTGFAQGLNTGGSSPHMRGTPNTANIRVFQLRDHPRICGEH